MSKVPGMEHQEKMKTSAKVDVSPANIDTCRRFCGSCPTYKENSLIKGEPGILFCGQGKSPNPTVTKKSCNCPGCGVHKRYELGDTFYCSK